MNSISILCNGEYQWICFFQTTLNGINSHLEEWERESERESEREGGTLMCPEKKLQWNQILLKITHRNIGKFIIREVRKKSSNKYNKPETGSFFRI